MEHCGDREIIIIWETMGFHEHWKIHMQDCSKLSSCVEDSMPWNQANYFSIKCNGETSELYLLMESFLLAFSE